MAGGGTLLNKTSAGEASGAAGQVTNFGFQVNYNKSGTNLQGHVNIIVRPEGRTYQVKGNPTSLTIDSAPNVATFNGKATIRDVTDASKPIGGWRLAGGNVVVR